MGLDSYPKSLGNSTEIYGVQIVAKMTAPAISVRSREGLTQTGYRISYGLIRPPEVEETGGVVNILDVNGKTGTSSITAPDGSGQTVRFGDNPASSRIATATRAGVAANFIRVR